MKKIWVTFQKAGFHRYPAAATDAKLADVSYLGFEHRHLFKFKVTIEVFDNDREIEFHQFLNWLEAQYAEQALVLDHKSCEMIAEELGEKIRTRFGILRALDVEVSEDGECGAIISWSE